MWGSPEDSADNPSKERDGRPAQAVREPSLPSRVQADDAVGGGEGVSAPCRFCGQVDEHVCVFCQVCASVTRHVRRGRRWRCEPCDERARAVGWRNRKFGLVTVERPLRLGVYDGRPRLKESLEELFGRS